MGLGIGSFRGESGHDGEGFVNRISVITKDALKSHQDLAKGGHSQKLPSMNMEATFTCHQVCRSYDLELPASRSVMDQQLSDISN